MSTIKVPPSYGVSFYSDHQLSQIATYRSENLAFPFSEIVADHLSFNLLGFGLFFSQANQLGTYIFGSILKLLELLHDSTVVVH